MRVLLRADASLSIGTGHVIRCLTLAQALRQAGVDCEFLCRPHPGDRIGLLIEQGFVVHSLPVLPGSSTKLTGYQRWLGCTEEEDAAQSQAVIRGNYDLIIVDHYGLGTSYQKAMRQQARHIMVIDDLANRPHDCDLLLDQNLLPDMDTRYQGLVPTSCRTLLGPRYALLREEFFAPPLPRSTTPRLLVNFGGSDIYGLTMLALSAIERLKIPLLRVDIIIAAQHPDYADLKARCDRLGHVNLHRQTAQMASFMQQATLMLGTGGTTHWERCITGLPGLVVTVADNQRPVTAWLDKLGACLWLGDDKQIDLDTLTETLQTYLLDSMSLALMSRQARAILPPDAGTQKVVQAVCTLTDKDE